MGSPVGSATGAVKIVMEFDWRNDDSVFPGLQREEIEESFEDPFGLRFLPDTNSQALHARYFCLGQASSGKYVFSLYRSNGKSVQIICSREMTENEELFYRRKMKVALEGESRV